MSLRLRKVVLLKEIPIGEVWRSDDPADRFGAERGDTFTSAKYELSRDGDDVTITGNVGTVTLPWASVLYAVSEPAEVKPVAKAGKR